MAEIVRDRIRDTSTTTGLGAIALAGAPPSGFRAFSAVMSNADTATVTIYDRTTYAFETFRATYNSAGNTLTRGTWLDGSTGAHLDLTAGTKDVFIGVSAASVVTVYTGLDWAAAVSVASATTTALGAAASNYVNITGTTTITAFDTMTATKVRYVKFAGALTLTHNATTLVLPGGENITTAAGDRALFVNDGDANWVCWDYMPKSGYPLTTGLKTIASATTTELGSTPYEAITISGTTTITSFGTTAPTGAIKSLTFSGSLTVTHHATSMILNGGASINFAAGDCAEFRHEGSGNWRMLNKGSTASTGTPVGAIIYTALNFGAL